MPHGIKSAALHVGLRAGLFRLAQFAWRRQAVILTFHRFWDGREGDPRGTSVDTFAACLRYLARHYRLLSLAELTDGLQLRRLPANVVAVTIDDGYHEAFSLAAPVLRRYGIRATIFVASEFINGRLWLWPDRIRYIFARCAQGRMMFRYRGATHALHIDHAGDRWRAEQFWCARAKAMPAAQQDDLIGALAAACGVTLPLTPGEADRPMTWTELRALAAEGFDIGAHTRTHPVLSQLPPARREDEIAGCRRDLEQYLGRPVRFFAYPNGRRPDYTPDCVAAVERAGYAAAVTTIPGGNTTQTPIFELRRIGERAEDLPHFVQAITGVDLAKDRVRTLLSGRGVSVP